MALSLVPRTEARPVSSRPSARDGLSSLAAAWRATQQPGTRAVSRVVTTAPTDTSVSGTVDEPPYWPDGPSAA